MGLRSRARRRATERALADYAAFLDRAPISDGRGWRMLASSLFSLDESRQEDGLRQLADIHIAGCARVSNEQFHGEPLDEKLDLTLLEVLAKRVQVNPAQIDGFIDRRPRRRG